VARAQKNDLHQNMMQEYISKYLNLTVSFPLRKQKISLSIGVVVSAALTLLVVILMILFVKLSPQIGANFFFSNDDPQMREENKIEKMFSQESQLVISVKGDIQSDAYREKTQKLSEELLTLEEVISLQSLTNGPGSIEAARSGPLWSRILIAKDESSTLIPVFIKDIDPETFIPKIEKVIERHNEENFEIVMSGQAYIAELLRRYLFKDLKIFSVAAFLLFGAMSLFFFRSLIILLGTLLACTTASMLTLLITQVIGIETGPLNANLSTIVFVLTLSHIIFIIFNWRRALDAKTTEHPAAKAIQWTFLASVWSMVTTLLGFLSLLFVSAMPLRQLGAAGAVGTLLALIVAYGTFPPFLRATKKKSKADKKMEHREKKIAPFFSQKHPRIFAGLMVVVVLMGGGLVLLNTDPSLLAYFKEGSELRKGLEYIDQNGGSSPLSVVVQDPDGNGFNEAKAYERLYQATLDLEENEEVGSAVSLPILLAQAKENIMARLLTMEWLIELLETEQFGEVAKYFVTEDRDKTLLMLRMRESNRESSRLDIIEELKQTIENAGLSVYLVGGIYSLQGHMAAMVASSLITGLLLLIFLFIAIGWSISRSGQICFALLVGLCIIPIMILGLLGYLQIPIDVISAPAANIAIAIGVDSMIHMLVFVKNEHGKEMTTWNAWQDAASHYWKPVMYTAIIIGGGFGIFALSQFPPTQRFGLMVVAGAIMVPFSALMSLAFVASSDLKQATKLASLRNYLERTFKK